MSSYPNLLLQHISGDALTSIDAKLPRRSYSAGESIMTDGSEGDFALLIDEGSTDIYKGELKVGTVTAGDVVGMLGLLEGGTRTADVQAGSSGCTGRVLDTATWQELKKDDRHPLTTTMLTNYLSYHKEILEKNNLNSLKDARAKLALERRRVLSAQFFVQMVLGLIVFTFALGYLRSLVDDNEATYISLGVITAYGIWSFLYVIWSGLPLRDFGITTAGFTRALRTSFIYTGGFVALMFAVKAYIVTFHPAIYGTEIVQWYVPKEGAGRLPLILAIYSFHAVIQEFIARGCIQGGLQQFIVGKRAKWTAIVVATLLFSSFHLMLDMKFAVLTIIPGLLWGTLFHRTGSLWAVSISHVIIGIVAVFMLSFVG